MDYFCDFCGCVDCQFGAEGLTHAKTNDGKQICDVCYYHDACPDARCKTSCKDLNCSHRPKLVSEFTK